MQRERLASIPTPEELNRVAQEYFGYSALRPPQIAAIQSLLSGRDTLCIMPTGSGKSAIYQLAGILVPGTTVVISPLIALQKDQLESIEADDLPDAALINSTQKAAERRAAFEQLEAHSIEFLFLAPEQLANPETFQRLQQNPPSLFVIDEAHCLSEWGHNFRPDYARLGQMIEPLVRPCAVGAGICPGKVLALTATASPAVREDILQKLRMHNPRTIVWGFDRPNLMLSVDPCPDEEMKVQRLITTIQKQRQEYPDCSGIVYVATQNHAEEVAEILTAANIPATAYHGGMRGDERHEVQDRFMSGELRTIVATNAFGMGIDKPDVRFVIHYDVPESVDSYYQEIGRAGRDGKPALAHLLFRRQDLSLRKSMSSTGRLRNEEIAKVLTAISGKTEVIPRRLIAEQIDLSEHKIARILNRLQEHEALELTPAGDVCYLSSEIDEDAVAEVVAEENDAERNSRRARVELMRYYATTHLCRRHYILTYFGEEQDATAKTCEHCDNCKAGLPQKVAPRRTMRSTAPGLARPFAEKSRVRHRKFGEGLVIRYEGTSIVVLFERLGTKALNLAFAMKRQLIEAA